MGADAILFLWQFPHFMAIAWMYREDYDRAGYLVLPKGKARVPFVTLEPCCRCLLLSPSASCNFRRGTLPFFTAPVHCWVSGSYILA